MAAGRNCVSVIAQVEVTRKLCRCQSMLIHVFRQRPCGSATPMCFGNAWHGERTRCVAPSCGAPEAALHLGLGRGHSRISSRQRGLAALARKLLRGVGVVSAASGAGEQGIEAWRSARKRAFSRTEYVAHCGIRAKCASGTGKARTAGLAANHLLHVLVH